MQKLNFLFLGAGYASIAALKAIRKEYFERANFTLVSAHDYHYHTVLLHTTAACGANVCHPLSKILDSKVNSNFAKIPKKICKTMYLSSIF